MHTYAFKQSCPNDSCNEPGPQSSPSAPSKPGNSEGSNALAAPKREKGSTTAKSRAADIVISFVGCSPAALNLTHVKRGGALVCHVGRASKPGVQPPQMIQIRQDLAPPLRVCPLDWTRCVALFESHRFGRVLAVFLNERAQV